MLKLAPSCGRECTGPFHHLGEQGAINGQSRVVESIGGRANNTVLMVPPFGHEPIRQFVDELIARDAVRLVCAMLHAGILPRTRRPRLDIWRALRSLPSGARWYRPASQARPGSA